jgi:alpha-ketoglutaric semialdehyde dehydrogenase
LAWGSFVPTPVYCWELKARALDNFLQHLAAEFEPVMPAKMLHAGIHKAYVEKMQAALGQKGVTLAARSKTTAGEMEPSPSLATVDGSVFLNDPLLHEEIFGPYSLMVVCKDEAELKAVWKSLTGQLSTTLMGTDQDFADHSSCWRSPHQSPDESYLMPYQQAWKSVPAWYTAVRSPHQPIAVLRQ